MTISKSIQNYLRSHLAILFIGSLALVCLVLLSQWNYLLFHILAEGFSLIIAGTIFVLTWNSRSFLDNGYLLVFGLSFIFIGGLDLLHTLAYKGMSILPGSLPTDPNPANLATQFWVAARYLQGITLVAAPFFIRRAGDRREAGRGQPNAALVVGVYAAVTALLILAIFEGWFPTAYQTGSATPLTPFKVDSEFLVILLYGLGILLLIRTRRAFDPDIVWLLVAATLMNILSEWMFTGYQTVTSLVNIVGHCFKIIAFYLAYKAIIEIGFLKPQQLLYRELAQSEAALRASESRERARAAQLEAIMDVAPAVIWIAHDAGARQVSGNRASADLLRLPDNANHSRYDPQVAGRFKFLDQDGREMKLEDLALHISASTGQPMRGVQETFVFQDGAARHLYGNVSPLLDEKGSPTGAVAAFLDMTDRVTAERALAESERRYRSLFESMVEGFAVNEVIFDDQGQAVDYRILEVNPAFEVMMHRSRAELINHTIRELLPDVVSPWIEKYAQVVRSGKPARFEDYSYLADRYFEAMVHPLGGSLCAAMATDVTIRHLSQEAQRLSESRLRRLVESNIIGIVYLDDSGLITLANDAFLTISGYTRQDLQNSQISLAAMTPPEYTPLDARGRAEAIERGACTPYEKLLTRKDGASVPILTGYAYLAEKKPLYLAFILDLTLQKQAEASAQEAAARLARSNAELKQANRELQDFAFVASHDLQEPLRKIQAFGERLKVHLDHQLDELSQDYLERMLSATGRMRRMIDDLLELSRVTTRGRPFEQVDLNGVAREVLSDLEVRLERTRGQVDISPLPTLEADPLQMHQLLLNLIGNALKFHKQDTTPVINLDGEYTSIDQMVIIKVKDNGIGFDQQYADRIFQPFQRLNGMGQFEGSGIGLSICRKIAERHAGTIMAESTPGQGATFIVKLPARHPNRRENT